MNFASPFSSYNIHNVDKYTIQYIEYITSTKKFYFSYIKKKILYELLISIEFLRLFEII